MAYGLAILDRTYIAAADLRTDIYCAVKLDSTGKVVLAGAGDPVFGVLQDKPNTGDAATVRTAGVTPLVVGTGNLAPGQVVMSDASGHGVAGSTGNYIFAVAETAGASGGAFASVLLTGLGKI